MSGFGGRGRGRGGGGGGGGRGNFYKEKYGGGGRGGGRGGGNSGAGGNSFAADSSSSHSSHPPSTAGGAASALLNLLSSLDGSQYPKYHSIETSTGWLYPSRSDPTGPPLFSLLVPRTQSDPFAKPTRCQLRIPKETAKFGKEELATKCRRTALGDYLLRSLHSSCSSLGADAAASSGGGWSGPKGGDVQIMKPGQNVLEQSAVAVSPEGEVTANLTVSLPARGRTILGAAASQIFGATLPSLVRSSLLASSHSPPSLLSHVLSVEDQSSLRLQLSSLNLTAFVADGSNLPRHSGASSLPLSSSSSVPFLSPPSLSVTLDLPNKGGKVTGMGVPRGVFLIVGGGFHGKSTLLAAIQEGIYDKVPGDGREGVVTIGDAVKVRSEDGRQLHSVCVSPFISNLPFNKPTDAFSTPDASGSTSQAAAVVEALSMGAAALLFDEDTCATNFMLRDAKMAALVAAADEPITPYISRIRSLYESGGVSSVMVVGGAGDYLNVADTVVKMKDYSISDVTTQALAVVASHSTTVPLAAPGTPVDWPAVASRSRTVQPGALRPDWKSAVREKNKISYGEEVELRLEGAEQLACVEQTNSLLLALHKVAGMGEGTQVRAAAEQIVREIDRKGLCEALGGGIDGKLATPRKYEIAAALNRLRMEGLIK